MRTDIGTVVVEIHDPAAQGREPMTMAIQLTESNTRSFYNGVNAMRQGGLDQMEFRQ